MHARTSSFVRSQMSVLTSAAKAVTSASLSGAEQRSRKRRDGSARCTALRPHDAATLVAFADQAVLKLMRGPTCSRGQGVRVCMCVRACVCAFVPVSGCVRV